MISPSQTPEQKPLVLAWVATILTILIFGGILLVVLTGRTPVASTSNSDAGFNGLSSSGEGRITGVPDLAEVTLGVESRATSPSEATVKNNTITSGIVDAVRGSGVAQDDVQTLSVSLNPEFSFEDGNAPQVRGYVASSNIRVTVRAMDKVGPVIDGSIAAGATNVQGVFFSFTPETLRKLEDQAREEAMQDAKRRATVLAQLGNVRLGKPSALSESLETPGEPPVFAAAFESGGGEGAIPIEAGTLEIVSHVDITYEIL